MSTHKLELCRKNLMLELCRHFFTMLELCRPAQIWHTDLCMNTQCNPKFPAQTTHLFTGRLTA